VHQWESAWFSFETIIAKSTVIVHMGYSNPWPGITARRQRDEAETRASDLQMQLDDCRKEVERLRAKLKQYEQ